MEITTIGIDLAKNVFAVCGADSSGRVLMRRQLRRAQVTQLHACAATLRGGNGGQRRSAVLGAPAHRARARGGVMSPALVMPYRKGNKTDRNDADAILEAVTARACGS